jgi:hypothetical protein
MPKKRLFSSLVLLATAACFASDLPKNTRLEVRLDETLGSDISQIGQDFSATLTRSISLGKEGLKKGDHVSGVVKYAESTLNYYRPGEIELELTSVTSSGKVRQIATNTLRFQGKERQADPATGKQDDRGARSEDMARGAIGVVGAANTAPSQTIPGTGVAVGPSSPATGMQVVLPAKSKLTFTITSS